METLKRIIKTPDFWVVFFIAVFLNIAWGGTLDYHLSYNSNLLPGLQWGQDNTLYQNDLMQRTFEHNYSFHYLLPFWLAKIIPINAVLWALFLIQNFLGVYAVYYLAVYLFKKNSVGYLSIFLLFPGLALRWALGGSAPFGLNIFPGLFTIPFLLFSLLCFLKKKYLPAFILLGLMFNFHGSHTVFVLCMFTFYLLFHFGEFDKKLLLKCYTAFAVGALPLLIWIFLDKTPTSGLLSREDWILFTRIRRSHHSYPFGFGLLQWEPFFCLLALTPFAWLARPGKDKQSVINYFIYAIIFMMVIGTVFTELIPIVPIVKFTFFRSSRFFVIFLLIYFANFVVGIFRRGRLIEQALVMIPLLIVSNLNYQQGVGGNGYLSFLALLSVSLGFLAQHFYPRLRIKRWKIPTLTVVFTVLFPVLMSLYFFVIKPLPLYAKYPVLSLYRVRLLTLASFWLALLLTAVFWKNRLRKQATAAALVITLVATSVFLLWQRPLSKDAQAWRALQVWVSENTPKDSRFLIPPYKRGFRSYSRRGVYITWFDADFLSYMPFLGQETVRRLGTLGYDFKRVYSVRPMRG